MTHCCHPGLYARDPLGRRLGYVSTAHVAPLEECFDRTVCCSLGPGDKPRDDIFCGVGA